MPSALKILQGDVRGHWTIVEEAAKLGDNRAFLVRCRCGTTRTVRLRDLRPGRSTSCGCSHNKHGMHRTPIYRRWAAMRDRCLNPNDRAFAHYGGRGISIAPRWRIFENFLADMGPRPDGLELERIDNDGPYSPTNCRWATRQEQMRNTRRTRFVTLGGKIMCVKDAAAVIGIKNDRIATRVHKKGVSHQDAIDYYAAKHGFQPTP